MFVLNRTLCNITRNMGRTILLIIISFLFVCFIGLYFGSIAYNKGVLRSLGNHIPVDATLTNSDGEKEIGLTISDEKIKDFLTLEIVNPVLTSKGYGNIEMSGSVDDGKRVSTYIVGSNSLSAFIITQEEMELSINEVNLMLSGNDPVCIVNQAYIDERKLPVQVGDTLHINLFQARYDVYGYAYEFKEVASTQIKIAGIYQGKLGDEDSKQPDIICPVEWLRQQYVDAGTAFYYTSATAKVKNPLNINSFKEKAEELNFNPINVQTTSNSKGVALSIDDRLFIQSASQIMGNIRTLRLFAIPVIVLIILLEAVVFFFVMNSRRKEIYIARCLGRKKSAITTELMVENFFLALAGGGLAMIFLILVRFTGWKECLLILIGYICVELIGTIIPAFVVARADLMRIFNKAI